MIFINVHDIVNHDNYVKQPQSTESLTGWYASHFFLSATKSKKILLIQWQLSKRLSLIISYIATYKYMYIKYAYFQLTYNKDCGW